MRVHLFALLISLFFTQSAFSQSFNWGAEIGIGHSSLPYSDNPLEQWRESGRFSFNAMLFAEYDLSSIFSVQSGVRYSQYGNDVSYDFNDEIPLSGFFQTNQHHLSIPIRVKYSPLQSRFYLLAGPQIGYILSADIYQEATADTEIRMTTDIIDLVDRINVTLSAGLGYRMALGNRAVLLQILYDRGLSSIGKEELWVSTWSTRALSFQTGIVL